MDANEQKRIEARRKLVENTYSSVEVVGRGTISIDPREVRRSTQFAAALEKAKKIFRKTL